MANLKDTGSAKLSCTALLALTRFISLGTMFLSTGEKQKLAEKLQKRQIVLMLGCFLYLIMACRTGLPNNRLLRSSSHLHSGISRFLTMFEKSSKVFATSISLGSI